MGFTRNSPSLYEVLELKQSATVKDIEQSYKRLMRQLEEAELVLYTIEEDSDFDAQKDQLQLAYEILAHPDKRADYDRESSGGNHYPSMVIPDSSGGQTATVGHVLGQPSEGSHTGLVSASTALSNASADSKSEIGDRAKAAADAVAKSYGLKKHAEDIRNEQPESPRSNEPYVEDEPVSLPNFEDIPGPNVDEFEAAALGSDHGETNEAESATRASAVQRIARRFKAFKSISRKARTFEPSSDVLAQIRPDVQFDGAMLIKLRQSCGASVNDIAELTKINKRYLNALEQNDFDALPAAVYVRGFIKQYAQALGLKAEEVAESYMELYNRHHNKG